MPMPVKFHKWFADYYPRLPAYIAAYTFFPMGILMGYIMYIFVPTTQTWITLGKIRFFPFICGSLAAIITSIGLIAIKLYAKKYVFEHFFILVMGINFMFVGGLFMSFQNRDPVTGIFLCFTGHGICYVPVLSYINIRSSKSPIRLINVSIAHIWYLLGVAVGATITVEMFDEGYPHRFITIAVGRSILFASLIAFCGYVLNHRLHKRDTNSYNYTKSLNEDIDRENEEQTIFKKKTFFITTTDFACIRGQNAQMNFVQPKNKIDDAKLLVAILMSKGKSMMYFYYPFYIIGHLISQRYSSEQEMFAGHWLGFLGVILSTVLLQYKSTKFAFSLSCFMKLFGFLIITIFIGVWFYNINYFLVISGWLFFMILGFGYSYPDLNILDLGSLKYNELLLAIGYSIEMITIGLVQYFSVCNYDEWFVSTGMSNNLIFIHSKGFIVLLIILSFGGLALLPNTYKNSLLEIKNYLYRPDDESSETNSLEDTTTAVTYSSPPLTDSKFNSRMPYSTFNNEAETENRTTN